MLDEFLILFMVYDTSNLGIFWREEVECSDAARRESPVCWIKGYGPFNGI